MRRRRLILTLASLVLICGFWQSVTRRFSTWLIKKCNEQVAPPAPGDGESGGGHGGGGGGAW